MSGVAELITKQVVSSVVQSDAIANMINKCNIYFNNPTKNMIEEILYNFLMSWIFGTLFIMFAIVSTYFVLDESLRFRWPSLFVYVALLVMLIVSIVYLAKLVSAANAFSRNKEPLMNVYC